MFSVGIDSSGGDAHCSSYTHHVYLPSAPWTVWVRWTCDQPASRCTVLCSYSTADIYAFEQHVRLFTELHDHVPIIMTIMTIMTIITYNYGDLQVQQIQIGDSVKLVDT